MSNDNENVKKLKDELEDLVLKSQAGDSGAFGRIYDLYVDKIYRYFSFRMDAEEALDLTENVFLKCWQNINKYKPTTAGFKAWMFRIAHNLLVDYYRYSRTHQELTEKIKDESDGGDPKFLAEKSMNSLRLRSAMLRLKDKHREVLVLRFINDLGNDEIAKVLGKSEIYVRVLQHRAIKELKEILLREEKNSNN